MKRAAGVLSAGVMIFAPVCAGATGAVLVVNSGGASLSVVDMDTMKETRRIPALREPHHLVLSPTKTDLLVGDTVGNEVLFLDPATFALRRRVTVADPYQLGFSPDGRLLVVNGLARNQVDVYDGATMALLKRFPMSSMPSHLDYSPDGRMVYVSLQGTNKLAAIDLRAMTVAWEMPVGKAPAGVMVRNGHVLVANMGEDNVAVVDPASGAVQRRIVTGRGAHQLLLSPDKRLIYVNNRVEGTTVAIDANTFVPVRTYRVPGGPDDIVFAPDGKLWITERFAQKLAVLDPVSGAVREIAVGRSPHGLFMNASAKAQ